MHRRSVLAAVGSSLLAGCSGRPGPGPTPVTPEEPNDDGTATLGEFYALLEDSGVERYERLDVTAMEREGDVVRLSYASGATHEAEFVDELGTIAALYGVYVGNGGTTDRLVVTVEPNFEGQAERFRVETDWARRFDEGSLSGRELANEVLATVEYPTSGNESG